MARSEWYNGKEGRAEHLVHLDNKAKELKKLLNKEKTMIMRGGAGRKCPLGGRAKVDDIIYFVETRKKLTVTHKGIISKVVESEKMIHEESLLFIEKYEKNLKLTKSQFQKWAGNKYLAVYGISNLEEIEPFRYKRISNTDDWIITDDINKIKAEQ